MTADDIFMALVLASLPVAVAYPAVYGTRTRWWKDWVGRALLIKATGILLLLLFSGMFYVFGPNYFGRDTFRIAGMSLLFVGLHVAFFAMLRELRKGVARSKSPRLPRSSARPTR